MNRDIVKSLAVAGAIIAIALAATAARNAGLIESETVTRLVMGTIGLMLVWYGNSMPKTFVPAAKARQVQRFGGWSTVLSGLAYAGIWVFAPISVAFTGGCAAVVAGIAATVLFALGRRQKTTA
ncbi:ammonium transporter [Brevundimonas sp.]|uniref:ammonium transporter n=1 Tax=Brevundimonas sp. TaxID=1871086 RepID=UPI00289A636B|nr:ammonium transporter [Brevundimonas sp.]